MSSSNKKEFEEKQSGTSKTKSNKQNNRKSNWRKGNKPKKDEPKDTGYPTQPGANEFAWHTPDAALLERASETSWAFQTGELVELAKPMWGNASTSVLSAQAGIMVIRDQLSVGGAGYYTPTYKASNATLPTYQAANTLLTEMRSKARIRNTYDAPDVFMLNMAMANIYAGVILGKRLAGTVRAFTYKNQYLPEALIKAQGFDPEWFKVNQFRFVTELNVLISEINKVYIPNRMHLFELINERFSNYYTEGSDIKDQIYVITPAFLNILTSNTQTWASEISPAMCIPGKILNSGTAGTGMVTQYDVNALYTGDNLLNTLRRMLENVLTEASTADITGDMANCFGEGDRFYLPMCDPMAIVTPVFNEEILETIHNMSWSLAVRDNFVNFYNQGSVAKEVFKIVQDPNDNRIGSYDCFDTAAMYANMLETESTHKIIDVHHDPDTHKTFEITRMRNLTCNRQVDSSDPNKMYVNVFFSTDLICDVEVYYVYNNNGNPAVTHAPVKMLITTSDSTDMAILAMTQAFHYRPMQVYYGSTGLRDSLWLAGETDIWAEVDYAMIKNMNTISLLTLLGAYNNI